MNAENVLRITITKSEELEQFGCAIDLLSNLEEAISKHPGYDYTRDIYHETRCSLMRICENGFIYDSGTYQIAKVEESQPAFPSSSTEKRINELAKKLYEFAEDTETLYDPCREDKPTLEEFSSNLYSYKMTAYLMESLLQGMDESGEDLPKYYEVMMDLIHHMERNDLEKGE